jgi:hemolysin activation/secretion protein
MLGGAANAQIPDALPGAVEAGRDLPQPPPVEQPQFELIITPTPDSPVSAAVDELSFRLSDIEITGATGIAPDLLRPLYEDLIGEDVTLSDLRSVAELIEQQYRAAGYLLVRAVVPPQRVGGGVFSINVVEGFIANITIEGGDDATRGRIRSYLEPVRNAVPLALADMERALLLANDLPGVSVSGALRPSPITFGAADLVITVVQPPVAGGISLDNRGSKFSGVWTVTGDISLSSLLSDGDQLVGRIVTTSRVHERVAGEFQYRHPVGSEGLVASLVASLSHGEPGSTLSALDVATDSWAVGLRMSYPIIRTRAETLVIDGGFFAQDARVNILAAPFSRDKWRVLNVGVTYLRSNVLGGNWSFNLALAQGLPFLGATPDGSALLSRAGASTDFTKVSGGFQYLAPLSEAVRIVVSGRAQYAFSPLMAGEEIYFGGAQIGRGYDPAAIAGDHGLGAAVELVTNLPVAESVFQSLQPYVFLDTAKVWSRIPANIGSETLTSVGIGMRAQLGDNLTLGVELAQTLHAVPDSDGGRQATKALINAAIRF